MLTIDENGIKLLKENIRKEKEMDHSVWLQLIGNLAIGPGAVHTRLGSCKFSSLLPRNLLNKANFPSTKQ